MLLIAGLSFLPVRKALPLPWTTEAFDESKMRKSLALIGAENIRQSTKIEVKAPDIAENGTIVPIEIFSKFEKTLSVFVFVEKNPSPLTASFYFTQETLPFISTRIKMRESSKLIVVAHTDTGFYKTERNVKVTIGGCGEEPE